MRRVHDRCNLCGFWQRRAGSHLRLLTQINFICRLGQRSRKLPKPVTYLGLKATVFIDISLQFLRHSRKSRVLDYFLDDSMFLLQLETFLCTKKCTDFMAIGQRSKPQNSLQGCVTAGLPGPVKAGDPARGVNWAAWLHSVTEAVCHRLHWALELPSYLPL